MRYDVISDVLNVTNVHAVEDLAKKYPIVDSLINNAGIARSNIPVEKNVRRRMAFCCRY